MINDVMLDLVSLSTVKLGYLAIWPSGHLNSLFSHLQSTYEVLLANVAVWTTFLKFRQVRRSNALIL